MTSRAVCSAASIASTVLLGILVQSCGLGAGDEKGGVSDRGGRVVECSLDSMLGEVDRSMRDYYLYADQVPVVDLTDYEGPEQLARDLRFEELDPFTRVSDTATSAALLDEGRFYGFGYYWLRDAGGVARLASVLPNSPVAAAGLERGDEIVSVDGVAWDDIIENGTFGDIGGTREQPVSSRWEFRRRADDSLLDVDLLRAEFVRQTVMNETVVPTPSGGAVGYFAFDAFLSTSARELDATFARFAAENVSDLVLDLRYNGGGYVLIARQIAARIGGSELIGQPLFEYRHNARYAGSDFGYVFEQQSNTLDLQSVVFLVDDGTASSSEIVINSLTPYMDVSVVGEKTTVGKPFISVGNDFCGKRLDAMEAEGFNANDVSVAGGIVPDCHAIDDLGSLRGQAPDGQIEGMLQAALDHITDGRCDPAPETTASRSRREDADGSSLPQEYRGAGAVEIDRVIDPIRNPVMPAGS